MHSNNENSEDFYFIDRDFSLKEDQEIMSFDVMNYFPSFNEADPHEILEKKIGTNALDMIFKPTERFEDQNELLFNDVYSYDAELASNMRFSLSNTLNENENKNEKEEPKTFPIFPSDKPEIENGFNPRSETVYKDTFSTYGTAPKKCAVNSRQRFSKKNDGEMFMVLKKLCSQHGIVIDNFYKDDKPLQDVEAVVLLQLSLEIGWKKNRRCDLLKRIRRISRKTTFSVRETKLLKKLIQDQAKEGYKNFEVVLEYFPGKTIDILKSHFIQNFGQ
mmetsp:Transcript_20613/g.18254  ORF Transcript_20613/g.18254 Transcript_20613/m.18254 type:complete len:275 (+) Transcript_20613:17-841(+)